MLGHPLIQNYSAHATKISSDCELVQLEQSQERSTGSHLDYTSSKHSSGVDTLDAAPIITFGRQEKNWASRTNISLSTGLMAVSNETM